MRVFHVVAETITRSLMCCAVGIAQCLCQQEQETTGLQCMLQCSLFLRAAKSAKKALKGALKFFPWILL